MSGSIILFYIKSRKWNVYLGYDQACKIVDIGDIIMNQATGKKHTLTNVCRVSEITKNLILAGQLDDSNLVVTFEKGLLEDIT